MKVETEPPLSKYDLEKVHGPRRHWPFQKHPCLAGVDRSSNDAFRGTVAELWDHLRRLQRLDERDNLSDFNVEQLGNFLGGKKPTLDKIERNAAFIILKS